MTLYLPAGETPRRRLASCFWGQDTVGFSMTCGRWLIQVCGSGMAAVVLDAVGHGGGPATSIQLPLESALPVEVAFPGRAVDGDAGAPLRSAGGVARSLGGAWIRRDGRDARW